MSPRQLAIGADIGVGLIAVSVAAALGNFVWHVVMPSAEPHAVLTRTRAIAPAAIDIAPIVGLAPFGSAETAAAPGDAAGALVLRGVLLANPATLSTALIGGGEGDTAQSYRVGDRLPDGSKLTSIAAQSVGLSGPTGNKRLGFPHRGSSPQSAAEGAEGAFPGIVIPDQDGGRAQSTPETSAEEKPASGAAAIPGALSGAAAIRALIPPSVAGIRPPPPSPDPRDRPADAPPVSPR